MVKRVRRVSDLPDWFDLKKYAGAASLDASGWYAQLRVRRALTELVQISTPSPQLLATILTPIRTAPLCDLKAESLLFLVCVDSRNSIAPEICESNISVNLTLPNELLVEQFKVFLQSLRAKTEVKDIKKFRRPDFQGWVRFGVLPFLDLMIWAFETKTKIPNRVMADAIFPTGEGGEEVVRKTTKPLVAELLDVKNIEILAALSEDKAEQKSA